MRYTNQQVSEMYEALAGVQKKNLTFPAKVSYAIVRNLKILNPMYEDIIEVRNKIITSNSKQEGEYFRVLPEKQDYVNSELKSLAAVPNEDISLTKIKLKDIESLDLPIDVMEGLFPMIDEG